MNATMLFVALCFAISYSKVSDLMKFYWYMSVTFFIFVRDVWDVWPDG